MSVSKERIPLKSAITIDDTHHYDFYSGIERVPRQAPYTYKEAVYPGVLNWVEQARLAKARFDTDPSSELTLLFTEARLFVENVTGYDLSNIVLADSSKSDSYFVMNYSPLEMKVRLNTNLDAYPYDSMSVEMRYKVIMTDLIHELMHSTGQNSMKLLGLRDQDRRIYMQMKAGLRSFDMRGVMLEAHSEARSDDLRTGHFFEEAIAEEVATRWKVVNDIETSVHGHRLCRLINKPELPAIPFRYLDADEPFSEIVTEYYIADSAYPAAGLQLIAEFTGVDIVQLMIDSRDPAKEGYARRSIVGAIESVQKGLYPKLRDLPYLQSSFVNGYEMILVAIEDNKRRRLGAAATAA